MDTTIRTTTTEELTDAPIRTVGGEESCVSTTVGGSVGNSCVLEDEAATLLLLVGLPVVGVVDVVGVVPVMVDCSGT